MEEVPDKINSKIIESMNTVISKRMYETQLEAKSILEDAKAALANELESKRKNIEEIVFEKMKAQELESTTIKEKMTLPPFQVRLSPMSFQTASKLA